jgi:mRNA-degrading endonuclease RelE of RelBE toxin-antitoxin system
MISENWRSRLSLKKSPVEWLSALSSRTRPAPTCGPIDRETALRLLKALSRFLETDSGAVKQLEGYEPPRYRLRVGDWRYIFRMSDGDTIEVLRVRNRREAYR